MNAALKSKMTRPLEAAFGKASHLPAAAQEQLAAQLLEDIEAETNWDRTLADSQSLLEEMARKARASRRAGKTIRKGIDEL